jgi:hypothetical protein
MVAHKRGLGQNDFRHFRENRFLVQTPYKFVVIAMTTNIIALIAYASI